MSGTFQFDTVATLRVALPQDIWRIFALYRRLEDPSILPRLSSDYERAVRNDGLFVIDSGEEILGVGGVFEVERDAFALEFGGTAIDHPIRHLGLQGLLLGARVCHALLRYRGSFPACIVTAVDPETAPASHANILRCGFHETAPLPSFLDACGACPKRGKIGPDRPCCCRFFGLSDAAARSCVRAFLRHEPLRENLARGRRLRLSSALFRRAGERALLRAFAEGRGRADRRASVSRESSSSGSPAPRTF